jgi:hypothetical protein
MIRRFKYGEHFSVHSGERMEIDFRFLRVRHEFPDGFTAIANG